MSNKSRQSLGRCGTLVYAAHVSADTVVLDFFVFFSPVLSIDSKNMARPSPLVFLIFFVDSVFSANRYRVGDERTSVAQDDGYAADFSDQDNAPPRTRSRPASAARPRTRAASASSAAPAPSAAPVPSASASGPRTRRRPASSAARPRQPSAARPASAPPRASPRAGASSSSARTELTLNRLFRFLDKRAAAEFYTPELEPSGEPAGPPMRSEDFLSAHTSASRFSEQAQSLRSSIIGCPRTEENQLGSPPSLDNSQICLDIRPTSPAPVVERGTSSDSSRNNFDVCPPTVVEGSTPPAPSSSTAVVGPNSTARPHEDPQLLAPQLVPGMIGTPLSDETHERAGAPVTNDVRLRRTRASSSSSTIHDPPTQRRPPKTAEALARVLIICG